MAKNPQVNIDITAKDRASAVIEDVADQVNQLERADAEVTLKARADALRGELREVAGQLRDLETTTTVKVDADVAGARKALADVETDAGQAGKGAGSKFGAGFVRDVGGPINEGAAGVLGDITDAFSTAGESIGSLFGDKVGSKITSVAGSVATAFGVGSIAYLAVTALWGLFDSGAKRAQKQLEELQATQLLLASGRTVEAVKKLQQSYGDAIDNAERLGLTTAETTAFVLGAADSLGRYGANLEILGDDTGDIIELQQEFTDLTFEQAQALADLLQPLYKARREFAKSGDSLRDLQREQFGILKGIGASSEAFLQLADEALPEVRRGILDYVAATERIPARVVTQIAALPDTDQVEATRRVLDAVAEDRAAGITPFVGDTSAAAKALDELARDRTARVRVILFDRYGNPIQGSLPGGVVPVPVAASVAGAAAAAGPAARMAGTPMRSSATVGGTGTVSALRSYTVNVNVAPGADPIATGRAVVDAIRAYERLAGTSWRT